MIRLRSAGLPVGLFLILMLVGCAERYGFRKPPQALLALPPAASPTKEKWPTAVPPGLGRADAASPVQQASFVQPSTAVAAADLPPAPMAAPALIRPDAIGSAEGHARVEAIAKLAQRRAEELSCYYVRLRKREVVNGAQLPEDLVLMKFRSRPFSVYIKALEESPTAGREIVFVNGQHNDLLQIRTGKGDILSGMRLELSPSSPRATANSRRTVLEAGFPNIIARFTAAVNEERNASAGLLQPLGRKQRPESPTPMECVRQIVPPGKEKQLPGGGERYWHFAMDPLSADYGLPMVICTYDERKREVEYYAHDRLILNVALSDDDFDPDRLWASR